MASITAIVPTYNRVGFLREAIESLTAQTRPVEEIIVWDDGSTDGTGDAVSKLGTAVRYFRSENGGKARALNAALSEARGELIWICDDDDIALPHAAERLSGMLDAAPEAGVAAGSYRRFRQDPETGERIESDPGYWPDLSSGSVLRHLLEDIFLFQNATLVRRAVYERVGPFREDLARSIDYDMIVRLALCAPVLVTDEPLFLQRKHEGVRGPATARHAAARSDEVWKAADLEVFSRFHETVPLSVYSALYEGELAARAGRLQRACVYARRTDWVAATDDFEAAAAMRPDMGLTPVEKEICRRAMAGKHGVAEALTPETQGRLARLGRSGAAGAGITRALARGVLWRGRVAMRALQPGKVARVAGAALTLGTAGAGLGGTEPAGKVAERPQLPPEAWLR